MTCLTLSLRPPPGAVLDLEPLRPERLAGLAERELAALLLRFGRRTVALGDIATIRPGDPAALVIEGTTMTCDRLGAGMTTGTLLAIGDAGALVGQGMKGGTIEVRGSVGALAAAEAAGGTLRVTGDAGPRLAGALPGAGGTSGGTVLVGGGCGERVAERMRRGLVVVAGSAGPHAAFGLRGGTVVIGGRCSLDPAPLMRRGTLLLATLPQRLLPTFADAGLHEPLWLALLERHLAAIGSPVALASRRVRSWVGDRADLGKGELMVAA